MIGYGGRNPGQTSAGIDPSSTPFSAARGGDDSRPGPFASSDLRLPLLNLSVLGQKMDSLRRFLSDSVDRRAPLAGDQLQLVSAEIASAVHHTILNGVALLASSQPSHPTPTAAIDPAAGRSADQFVSGPDPANSEGAAEDGDVAEEDGDIVEIDVAELLAEHVHFCEICGKGFKRDANLRMHMRAHGNRFKTLEFLSKPPDRDGRGLDGGGGGGRKMRFSCPFAGCNRNRHHGRFRPLKSAVCVKNHFKRSHCPKMYSCHRCGKKSFSVMADLKSHLKHCGENRWRCSCGTSFSRKDKLFGHVALFEGHLPAVGAGEEDEEEEEKQGKAKEVVVGGEEDIGRGVDEPVGGESLDPEFFERLMEELERMEGSNWPAR